MFDALFKVPAEPLSENLSRSKMFHSICTTQANDEAHSRKREWSDLEQVRMTSLEDEKIHQKRELEMVVRASSSMPESNTIGVVLGDVGTNDYCPDDDPVHSEKPDPPSC